MEGGEQKLTLTLWRIRKAGWKYIYYTYIYTHQNSHYCYAGMKGMTGQLTSIKKKKKTTKTKKKTKKKKEIN